MTDIMAGRMTQTIRSAWTADKRMVEMNEQEPVVAARIRAALTKALTPSRLEVIDESYKHAKHAHMISRAGKAGAPGETHFLIKVVSASFSGKSLLDRHRMVNEAIVGEMGPDGVHAIAITARAPGE